MAVLFKQIRMKRAILILIKFLQGEWLQRKLTELPCRSSTTWTYNFQKVLPKEPWALELVVEWELATKTKLTMVKYTFRVSAWMFPTKVGVKWVMELPNNRISRFQMPGLIKDPWSQRCWQQTAAQWLRITISILKLTWWKLKISLRMTLLLLISYSNLFKVVSSSFREVIRTQTVKINSISLLRRPRLTLLIFRITKEQLCI